MKCKNCKYERLVCSKLQWICDAMPEKPVLYFIKDAKLRFAVQEEPCHGKLFKRRKAVEIRELSLEEVDIG